MKSGLPFTEIHCQYSIQLLKWLLQKFPGSLSPLEAGSSPEAIQQLCQAALPGIEFYEAKQGNWNLWNRIKLLSGHHQNAAALQWLLQLIDQQEWNAQLKEQLYDQLKIFVRWKLDDPIYNRSFLRCPVKNLFYRDEAKNAADSLAIISQPVGRPLTVTDSRKEELVAIARVSLAMYYRETDPVTHADAAASSLFDMGRGLQIVLLSMHPGRQLSLESYIGYMAFKNGIPLSYGGGWVFGDRCTIGVNIYPPFRGGESAELFCQVLRLYHQYFKVQCFVVKPYQFGKANREGLKSAAFWFYYKLGFRPQQESISQLAAADWERLSADKAYRTPLPLLRQFTGCNLQWIPFTTTKKFTDADDVSAAISRMIIQRLAGNRVTALASCRKELAAFFELKKIPAQAVSEKNVWDNWSLLLSALPEKDRWNKKEKAQFLHLIQLKAAGAEKDFVAALQRCNGFWRSVALMQAGE